MMNRDEIENWVREEKLVIKPFDRELLKPASYTFRLGGIFNESTPRTQIIIPPKQFIILESQEFIHLPNNLVGILSTRGSIAKMGLDCLLTDTIIEPNSNGKLTFCTKNHSDKEVLLKIGDPIVKCLFIKTG